VAITLEERYERAANSTDLRARAGREGDIEAIVAVAWNRSRVGAALMRLHSDWDGIAKRGGKLEQSFLQLKSLPEVRGNIVLWAQERRMDNPEAKVEAVLCWWLDRICKACNGTKWVQSRGRPNRPCNVCHGKGEAKIPCGDDGRDMLAYIGECTHRARASIQGRMRPRGAK
jgi:hypothetical protein